jgi:hypothetical protein
MANINELLRNHVTLEVACLDRIYLNGYIPNLQIPGQLVTFLVGHRKQKIPSPALLNKMTQRFVQDIKQYAEENDIPIVHFKHGQRKDDIANQMRPAVAGWKTELYLSVSLKKKPMPLKTARRPKKAMWDLIILANRYL